MVEVAEGKEVAWNGGVPSAVARGGAATGADCPRTLPLHLQEHHSEGAGNAAATMANAPRPPGVHVVADALLVAFRRAAFRRIETSTMKVRRRVPEWSTVEDRGEPAGLQGTRVLHDCTRRRCQFSSRCRNQYRLQHPTLP